MDQGALVREQIDAGARFLAEFHRSYPVQLAFWLKNEEGHWYLYIASDRISDNNFDVAYGEVVRIARALQDPWFDAMQVKVLGTDEPLAKAVADAERRYPRRAIRALGGMTVAWVGIEDLYVYPSPISVAAP